MIFTRFCDAYHRFARRLYSYDRVVKNKLNQAYKGLSVRSLRIHVLPWFFAVILILLGIFITERLEEEYDFLDLRYRAYQIIQNLTATLKGEELRDNNTVLVLIGDEEFWKGDYARRTPINQKKLADLMYILDQFEPKVIALDFDFASPTPDGSIVQHADYKEETRILASTIQDIAYRRRVILPKTLGWDNEFFMTESDVYDNFKSEVARAGFGYILLPSDYRIVPLSVPLKDGTRLDSFSEAIVRAFDLTGKALQYDKQDGSIVYSGGFLYENQIDTYYANQIIAADRNSRDEIAQKLGGRIVIIGAAWSEYSYGRGDRVDLVSAPVGSIPAVFVHANWVESILAARIAKPLGKWPRRSLEFLFGIGAYVFFTRRIWWLWKLLIFVPSILVFWLGIAYLSVHNLNLFLDPVTPSLIAFSKAMFEQVNHWRKDANTWEKQQSWLMGLWLSSASRGSK